MFKLLCFLIFTRESPKKYDIYNPQSIDKSNQIVNYVHNYYYNDYFSKMKKGDNDKIVTVSAIVYNSDLYKKENTTLNTSIYFKGILGKDIELVVTKMVTTYQEGLSWDKTNMRKYEIVEYFNGKSIPNESELFKNHYDKCMIVDY